MARFKPPQTGIEIVEGIPGSGKSYYAVKRMLLVLEQSPRPIFAALPLRFRVIRKYLELRGHGQSARLLFPLSVDHLKRFLERNSVLVRVREHGTAGRWSEGRIAQAVREECGESILWGPEANDFPIGSLFILDEMHRMFPQKGQDKEPDGVLEWATMHRHFLHWIWCLSQNRMQVSLTFRRNCVRYVSCLDKRHVPIFWKIKIPVPFFFYEEYPAALEDELRLRRKPSDTWGFCPWMDGGVVWRMYDSFTHAGSGRRLKRAMEEARRLALSIDRDDWEVRHEEQVGCRVSGCESGSVGGDSHGSGARRLCVGVPSFHGFDCECAYASAAASD